MFIRMICLTCAALLLWDLIGMTVFLYDFCVSTFSRLESGVILTPHSNGGVASVTNTS